jgi:hypothetical protein
LPSSAAACSEFEGVDVESGTVVFFDENGTPLEARFTTANASGKIFGPIGWVRSGEYRLVPKTANKDDSLALALFEARYMEPGAEFTSVEQVKNWLRAKGLKVDWPAVPKGAA